MKKSSGSPIILLVSRLIAPYIMVYGLYVLFHGHYSPGGGFQSGAILAASIILMRVAGDEHIGRIHFPFAWSVPLGAIGVLIFFGIGFWAMLMGSEFLDYSALPLPYDSSAEIRYMGILFIEVGVALAVMAILVMIYDLILEEAEGGENV